MRIDLIDFLSISYYNNQLINSPLVIIIESMRIDFIDFH